MQFAVFTVSTPKYSPEQALSVLSQLGYDGVEWRVIDQQPSPDGRPGFWQGNRATLPLSSFVEDAPRLRQLAEQAGLATINVGAYVQCSDPAGVERVMQGAQLLGAPSARIRVPRFDASLSFSRLRDQALGEFRDVQALARQYGVRALIETHQDTILPSASALGHFLDRFDPAWTGAIWDPGNMVREGFENYRLGLEALGPYLAHVQLKSALWQPLRTRADGSLEWTVVWAPLKKGIVDVRAVFEALAAVGYDAWISFEDFSTEQPLQERLRDNLAYARSLLVTS
jgi:sugar phosphate isomerase/epimerase